MPQPPPTSIFKLGTTLNTTLSHQRPRSNGFAENFVKLLCKLIHTAIVKGKDPKRELHNYFLQYRATPHTTLGKSPAEVLFRRKIQTELPQYHPTSHTKESKDMRTHHNNKKLLQKALFDKRYKIQPKPVYVGDKVLLTQVKSTIKPPFDPHPYNVIKVKRESNNNTKIWPSIGSGKNYITVLEPRLPHLPTS